MISTNLLFLELSKECSLQNASASSSGVSFSYITIRVISPFPKLTSRKRMGASSSVATFVFPVDPLSHVSFKSSFVDLFAYIEPDFIEVLLSSQEFS